MECSNIEFIFNDSFKLKNIPDEIILNMIDNIGNRLFTVNSDQN